MITKKKPIFCRCGEKLVETQEKHQEINIFTGKKKIVNKYKVLSCPKSEKFIEVFLGKRHDSYFLSSAGYWTQVQDVDIP